MSSILPPDELAAMYQLGSQISSYSFQRVQSIVSLFVFTFIAVMGILGLPLALAAFVATLVFLHPGSNPSDLFVLLFAAGFVAFCVWVIWIAVRGFVACYRQFGLTVSLYPGGLIMVKGSKARLIRWEQVRDVQEQAKRPRIRGVSGVMSFTYTVQLTNGEKLIFNSLIQDVEELGEGIKLMAGQQDRR